MATDFSTRIIICKGVPIDSDYENTLYFEDETERRRYFQDKTLYLIDENSYQRTGKNSIKVNIECDLIADANYLIIQNISHTSKWYYCFIKETKYINDVTSEIDYEVDVIQTWLGNCTIGKSFIERNHTLTDVVGENLIPESINTGNDYKAMVLEYLYEKCDSALCSYDPTVGSEQDPVIRWFWNFPTIEYYISFNYLTEYAPDSSASGGMSPSSRNQIAGFQNFINERRNKSDSIHSIFFVPNICTKLQTNYGIPEQIDIDTQNKKIYRLPTHIDGYSPKNNKLFTYPYCRLQIENGEGQTSEYRFEDFYKSSTAHENPCIFAEVGNGVGKPEIRLIPLDYKGEGINMTEAISMNVFPNIAWSGSAMKEWLNYNENYLNFNILQSAIHGLSGTTIPYGSGADQLAGLTSVGVGRAISNGLQTAYMANVRMSDLQRKPNIFKNVYSGSTLDLNTLNKRFSILFTTIKYQFAEIVDNFFSKYGYAIQKVDYPLLKARKEWTYIKTAGCVITGDVSQNVEVKLKGIFDNGITFWVNPENVGNYELDNSPEGEEPIPPVPSDFVARLEIETSELGNMTTLPFYNNERYNAYIAYNIHLPACTAYAYGRSVEIAYHLGKQALIRRTDGVAGSYDWKGGRGEYASPNTTGSHYAYPSGENCLDACSLGEWNVTSEPQVGDIISWYYENGDDDGHVAVVEQILHYDSNGRADRIMTSNSASGGLYFYTAEIRRDEYSKEPHTNWLPIPEGKGKWYNGDGTVNKIWCGGFAHNPAFYVD